AAPRDPAAAIRRRGACGVPPPVFGGAPRPRSGGAADGRGRARPACGRQLSIRLWPRPQGGAPQARRLPGGNGRRAHDRAAPSLAGTLFLSTRCSINTSFWKAGHTPTLFAAFLYFDLSFMVWYV